MLERDPSFEYEESSYTGPGAALRAAREEKGISIEDIAAHLHINTQVIVDIEADDFANSAALIYTRGYLRAYARQVGLAPTEILHSFEQMGWRDIESKPHTDLGHQLRSEKSWLQKYWLIIAGVLLAALVLVWMKII